MKLHYFHQPAADPDDAELAAAIAAKVVPATCLLGGHVIDTFRRIDRKPCDACEGPREKCGGTPKEDPVPGEDPKRLARIDRILSDESVMDFYKSMEKKD